MMNSSFDPERQESLKRRWQEHHHEINNIMLQGAASNNPSSSNYAYYAAAAANTNTNSNSNMMMGKNKYKSSSSSGGDHDDDDDLALSMSTVVPAVTVVLEGRSICQRISLHNHGSYQSLAKALRHMFVDNTASTTHHADLHLDLSNAIPGHLIAYEDMEDDLLLAGDLSWKDFVRVAKRIRILPVKGNSRKGTT